MLTAEQVESAIDQVVAAVRADSADLVVDSVGGGEVVLSLVINDMSCAECIAHGSMLEKVIASQLNRLEEHPVRVTVHDPRGDDVGFGGAH